MAYEIEFTAQISVANPNIYFNDCCWGGDVICERLLPFVRGRFSDIQTAQEDWGWFIWFRQGAVLLAIDIFCDEKESGRFRVHISANKKKWLIFRSAVGPPETAEIKEAVVGEIRKWGTIAKITRFSPDFTKEIEIEPV
jgi:hypothetical protein